MDWAEIVANKMIGQAVTPLEFFPLIVAALRAEREGAAKVVEGVDVYVHNIDAPSLAFVAKAIRDRTD